MLADATDIYHMIFHNTPAGMVLVDQEGRILESNATIQVMLGYRADELLLHLFNEFTHPEDYQIGLAELSALATRARTTSTFEKRYLHKQGDVIYAHVTVSGIYDAAGGFLGATSIVMDVTTRKRAEQDAAAQRQRLEALSGLSEGLARVGTDHDQVLAIVAQKVATLVGDTCVICLVSDDQLWINPVCTYHVDPAMTAFLESFVQPVKVGESIIGTVVQSGKPILVAEIDQTTLRASINPSHHPFLERFGIYSLLTVPLIVNDRVIGTIGITRNRPRMSYTYHDQIFLEELAARASLAIEHSRLFLALQKELHERHQAEQARHASEAQLRSTLASLDDLLFVFDEQRRFTDFYQPPTKDTLLVPPEVFLGQTIQCIGLPPNVADKFNHAFDMLQTTDTVQTFDYSIPLPEGKRWFNAKLSPRLDLHHALVGATMLVRDITDRKEAERMLMEANQQLESKVQERTEALSQANREMQHLSRRLIQLQEHERNAIARDFHDEIGQQLTGLKLMLQSVAYLPSQEQSGMLERALGLVRTLMNQLHNLCLNLRPPMLDDFGLLQTLVWHFERYIQQTAIVVDFDWSGLEQRFSSELEIAVYRIIQEALTNVARHAQVARVHVHCAAATESLVVRITDAGRGFDLQDVYGRRHSTGLIGMRERAEMLGGSYQLRTQPGAGCQLTVVLPLEGHGPTGYVPRSP